jgi:hypothetical protein
MQNSQLAGGPDDRVHFTLEGAPSKLRLGGGFPGPAKVRVHSSDADAGFNIPYESGA